MRILGWVLGALFLTDGLLALINKRPLLKEVNLNVGRSLPEPVGKTLKKASDVNETARAAMGINNLIAGAGMVLVASLIGWGRHRARG